MEGSRIKRIKLYKRIVNRRQLFAMLALPLFLVFLFQYMPMAGVQIAFRKYNAIDGIWHSPFVGFKQFEKFFRSYHFSRLIGNTLTLSIYQLLAGFPMPIALALMLNALPFARFRKIVQMTTYLPHFISVVVLVSVINQLFNTRIGVLGLFYKSLTGSTLPDVLAKPGAFAHLYVWSGIWQNIGWNSIIYFAALSNVDPSLHEASVVDGATRFERMVHIDFPAILPTATILLILSAGSIMSVGFQKVYLMQNDLNLRTSEIISTYVYKVGLTGVTDFSYATAIGLFNSMVNLLLIIVVNEISKKVSETSLW